MKKNNNFSKLQRKVYIAYHRDGILDLVAGSVVLGFGLNMLTDNVVFLVIGWLAILLYVFAKQRVTVPRFGYVRFEAEEKTVRKGLFSLGVGVLVLLFFFVLNIFIRSGATSPNMQTWLQRYHMVPLSAVLFGLPALVAAIFLSLKRFYLYALLAVGLPAVGAWINVETYIPIMSIGLTMLAFGVVLLVTFLKKYPLNDAESEDVHG
jgi:hypothetical protein